MALPTAPTTELEAVNAILRTIGEEPATSLDPSAFTDQERAKSDLAEASRSILQKGWWFNREWEDIAKDGSDKYPVDTNAYSVKTVERVFYRSTSPGPLVSRGGFLYSMTERTNVLPDGPDEIAVEYIVPLTWEDLPQVAREAIFRAAARKFVKNTIGDTTLIQWENIDETKAYADLVAEDLRQERSTFLQGSQESSAFRKARNGCR